MLIGRLEVATRWRVMGWAHDPQAPDTPVRLDIVANGTVVDSVTADQHRSDLEQAGHGAGRHGFDVRVTGLLPPCEVTLRVRRPDDGADVPGSPVVLVPFAPAQNNFPSAKEMLAKMIAELPPIPFSAPGVPRDADKQVAGAPSETLAQPIPAGREGWFQAIDHPRVAARVHARLGGLDPVAWLRSRLPSPVVRGLEINCGSGELALLAAEEGWFGSLDAFDPEASAIASARRRAVGAGLDGLRLFVADPDSLVLEPGVYDVIYACHALHRAENLEHLFAQCAAALRPGGFLFVNDYVGPPWRRYAEGYVRAINLMLPSLPFEKRWDRLNGSRQKEWMLPEEPRLFLRHDPSEAPRSDEIVPVLRQFFDVEVVPLGMDLSHEILRGIVHNFDPDDAKDNALMDNLLRNDEAFEKAIM